MIDVVEEVAEGRARIKWSTVTSHHAGMQLVISVFRDAAKFDQVPAMTWAFEEMRPGDPYGTDELFNGVRLPASAFQLQRIADLTGSILMTPKVIDLMWLKPDSLRFGAVVNTRRGPKLPERLRTIVATSHIHVVHRALEAKIASAGGDDFRSLITCVGKYWCLVNELAGSGLRFGDATACNYGWFARGAGSRGVTPGVRVYQTPGFRHNSEHRDPSQTIRLMHRKALLTRDGVQALVDLHDVAADPELAPLLHHGHGPLVYLRQRDVPAGGVELPMYMPPALC